MNVKDKEKLCCTVEFLTIIWIEKTLYLWETKPSTLQTMKTYWFASLGNPSMIILVVTRLGCIRETLECQQV